MQIDRHVSVIALHGLALSEEEVEQTASPVEEYLGAPGVRWIFPRAPKRKVTILGCEALAWYDIATYDRSCLDVEGIESATEEIRKAVHEERMRDPERKVVLMGFSQGGALALNAGLQLKDEVDGIVALATALPFPENVKPAHDSGMPVFLGHGLLDPTVPYTMGRETHQVLEAQGYETEWHTYLCGHTITRRELHNVSDWMRRHFLQDSKDVLVEREPATEVCSLPN
ncbi:MAG: dienelactone hydrolase family protein [Vicinamibacteria bacterium]